MSENPKNTPVETPKKQLDGETKQNQNQNQKSSKKKGPPGKSIFDHNIPLNEYNEGRNHEGLMRMKFLTTLASEIQEIAPNLSWHYATEMNQVAEKMVIRIHNRTKQFICKACRGMYQSHNDLNEKIKIKRICKLKYYDRTCRHCGTKRKVFLSAKQNPKKKEPVGGK